MQSFRERCGFHGNQQNYQPTSQESSRLENYRHQSQPALNCERHREVTKNYYAHTSYQGYENSVGEKYPRDDKHIIVQQLQGRVSFASFSEGNVYPGHYTGEDGLQNWAQSQTLGGTKYEENLIKKTPGEGRGYQDPAGQNPFRSHSLHHPQQQALPYAKIPRQKVQNNVPSSPLSFSQASHFNQSFPTSTYSTVTGGSQVSHTYKSCTAPSNPQHDHNMAAAGQLVQAMHGYQSTRMTSYEQPQLHHAQETLHYQNMAKYQHYSQQNQTYCQSETPSRTPEQYYQPFSPSASHSPARSVGRSPSYSSTPSPLMPNLDSFQYNQQQQQHNTGTFPLSMTDHSHYMPLINPSPTGTSSPESQSKSLQNDKLPETLLSDLSLQSLTALTSQVENISNTVQQLLLSKSGVPQKKVIKASPRTPEQVKGQHCSPENSTYSSEQIGTPLSEALGTPQSVHTEIPDTDYLSGSEDQLERNYLYCGSAQSPARANNSKMKPESISTCSVTSPDNMSTKSDDSFQSIRASLPLETFAKLVSSERECPHLLVNALSQEELSTEIIALQDAIDNEKAEKAWVDSPVLSNDSPKSPLNLENSSACVESAMQTWSGQENVETFPEDLKKSITEEAKSRNQDMCYSDKSIEREELPPETTEVTKILVNSGSLCSDKNITATASSASYTSSSDTSASTTCSKTMDPFGWTDKNITESCLRWKDLELSLHESDLEKDLFQVKDNKIDCQLDVPDVETPLENDSSEEFNKEGAGDLAYTDIGKTDNEKWLEDTRDCYTEEDFQDIPDIPSQKESNLEPEDYSSLCDFSDRKSFIYDNSPSKPLKDMETVSSINTPESVENPSLEEKENSAPSQLSGHSIILLGPAVATESKVESWFESTITHIKTVGDIKEKNEEDAEACALEPLTLPDREIKDLKVQDYQLDVKAEEPLERKPRCRKKNPCRAVEVVQSDKVAQNPVGETAKADNEKAQEEAPNTMAIVPVAKTPAVEVMLARMCTRSSTAKADLQVNGGAVGPPPLHQDKTNRKGAFNVKETASFKSGRRGGKAAVVSHCDRKNFMLQSKSPSKLSSQKAKGNNIELLKDEKSMILRSRSKKQELFQTKRRKGKRGMSMVIKKRASLKKILANNCTVPDTYKLIPKVKQRMKLSNSGVPSNAKVSDRRLHSLKRKPNFISPVPAKKKNLILRSKNVTEEKSEPTPHLFKKIRAMKKEKVKVTIAAKKTCKVILKTPSVHVTPEVCIKVSSRSSYAGAVKTKVLPPRKGRGLKLEAIVQKMTSPNQKKQGILGACLYNVVTVGGNNLNALTPGKELRELSSVSADNETRMVSQNNALSAPDLHSLSCRGSNSRSLKGTQLHRKKQASSSLHCTSTHRGTEQEGNYIKAKRLSTVPKRRIRRGRSKGALNSSKNVSKRQIGASPSVLLTSKDKTLSESVHQTNKCKKPMLKETSSVPSRVEESSSQVQARKKTKYASFNGYTKRQRKCAPQNKPAKQTTGSKRTGRRKSVPVISPKEPEIKLKYVSAKPVRSESRVRPFSPYVQVEEKNEYTTTCTVINTVVEESRLLKERSIMHSVPHSSFASSRTLPLSSRMQLGPLVCKAVPSGCLVCCLCRNPANFKDLGDLCGPYYPMDCLPNKKLRPKDKFRIGELPVEKTPKMSDSVCTVGSGRAPSLDSGELDLSNHTNLRTSARALLRKLPSCYCCSKKVEITETEKPRRYPCSKTLEPPFPELETQEHWVHEACAVWTSGVYLVAGKLYGIHEAIQMAANGLCPKCQRPGATVGCSHKACEQSYHFTCAVEAGCLLSEENFSLRCPKHKKHLV
ncbi:retinoic acid-induced protein 1 [Xenopus laevis]|uniref:Retinoic acid-induced protein 1 n=2 Tax=Xenopus laevis TaxID=8355 RepID=A0A1L8EYP3_XENLA|nr:retinoic acid-induced protein 1 [Xenopus laevis]XP_018092115.1 retinoic acid-induced protein 1 [Xenopus laevis]XP_018092116.1 retinoic acid-induced protein 1 [Xenopus laevis]OCT64472.1 hypothetical protein XELAEV_18045571mg [Xenopus laevis]